MRLDNVSVWSNDSSCRLSVGKHWQTVPKNIIKRADHRSNSSRGAFFWHTELNPERNSVCICKHIRVYKLRKQTISDVRDRYNGKVAEQSDRRTVGKDSAAASNELQSRALHQIAW